MEKTIKLLMIAIGALFLPLALAAEMNPKAIDDFERPNPGSVYKVEKLDDSSLTLTTTQRAYEGAAAMQMEYTLKTDRAYGSTVLVRCEPELNDWSKYQQLWIWVKGDGSGNIFKIFFTDESDEVWEYQDRNILLSQRWQLLKVDFDQFTLTTQGKVNNRVMEKNVIQEYGFAITGRTSDQFSGIIYLDSFSGAAESIAATHKRPEIPKTKLDLGLSTESDWRQTPENGEEMFHSFTLKVTAAVGDFSSYLEIQPVFQEFGEAAVDDRGDSRTGFFTQSGSNQTQFMQVEIPNFQVNMRNLGIFDNVQLGNQWIDYGRYVYSPQWGYKGISADGSSTGLAYNLFYLKHRYGSYTYGSRIDYEKWGIKSRGMVVYAYDSAKRNTEVTDGSLDSNPTDLQTEKIDQDMVLVYEVSREFWKKFILRGRVGADMFKSLAEADRTDPFNPVFLNARETPVSEQGNFWTGGLDMNGLWTGSSLNFEYRDISDKYLPRWRQDRTNFANDNGNQKSYNVNASQELFGFVVNGGYQDLQRVADSNFYRYSGKWEIGHQDYDGIAIYYGKEYLNDYNYQTDTRYGFNTYRNFKVIITNLYIASRISKDTNIYAKYSSWSGWDRGLQETMYNHSLSLRGEHYFLKNIILSAEYIHTQYSHPTDEPTGPPFDDNRTQATLKMYF